MKTSNKLLIAFGAFLFIAPLLGMAIISRMYYKDASKMDFAEIQEANSQPFQTASKGRKAFALNKSFSEINFPNGNNSNVELHFKKSKSYGVKIPEEMVGSILLEVINGTLNIKFDKKLSISDYSQRIIILVYAPNLDKLNANNFMNLNLVVQADSLALNLKECIFNVVEAEILNFAGAQGTTNQNLYEQTTIHWLGCLLDRATLNISGLNLETLNIVADNSSNINLRGGSIKHGESTIGELVLKTIGKNQVSIKDFKLIKATSSFSDSTQLTIPTSILKMLLKE